MIKDDQVATVTYQVATYVGEIEVPCKEYDGNEDIIAKAKDLLTMRSGGSLPGGACSYKGWVVVKREPF